MNSQPVVIREFRFPADYQQVHQLWESMEKGVRVGRSDTRAEIEKKTARDPDLFLVAEIDENIVGSVIGGFDGRRGLVYLKSYLMVTPDNQDAARYYERHGWQHMEYVRLYGKDLQ